MQLSLLNTALFLCSGGRLPTLGFFNASEIRAHVLATLGITVFPGDRMLPSAKASGEVLGIRFSVTPSNALPGRKTSKHRTFVSCPCCYEAIPMGRLHQHARLHVAPKDHADARKSRRSVFAECTGNLETMIKATFGENVRGRV